MPDKRWKSLLRPTVSQLVVAVLIGGLAFSMTVQIRDDDTDDYSGVRGDDLVELLKSLDAANERLSTQTEELTATRNGLLDRTQRSEQAEKQAKLRAEQLAILAGTSGATGPGVEVVVNDPNKDVDASQLLDAIESLRDAGAEAIAINGVARVIAQSYFLDDDDEIRVDGREIKRPYRIEAIGDSSTLAGAVRFPGGLIDRISTRGGTAIVTEKDKVTITALADIKSPEYARPSS
ncbi:DUF881 domain-containing protein [Aeromicrobium sp.]|uniref:DUF881 domain-containing protein n=1 Tax=Aeromicrobium sp. TaxID=1871063 RepID=UPI002FC78685